MLQAIRDKAQGIFAWAMLILVGIPFAFWGINNYFDSGKESPVATVGERDFYERDLARAYQQDLANLVGLGDIDEKLIKRQSLERLIRDELVAQAAEREGLVVPDSEVRAFVQTLPYFQTEGKFDKEKYNLMLSAQGMNSAGFVAQVRRALTMEQLRRGIADSAFSTGQQVDRFYRLQNQEREVEFVTIPVEKGETDISPAAITQYYQSHPEEFQSPETVSVSFLTLNLDDVAKSVQVTEEELKAYYEEQKESFTSAERRRVSHILVSADFSKPDEEKAALAKITQIRERIAQGEDFAKLAKELSDDKASAEKGGDLGYVVKGSLEPNLERVALSLAKGAVSDPVKTSFGYHLITVTELIPATTRSFEEMKNEIAETYRKNVAENKFYELGQQLSELAFEHPDSLEPAAAALRLPIQETKPFTREAGEGIAAEEAVRKAAFSDEVLNGKNSEPVEVRPEQVIVLRLKEHHLAETRPIDEVKGQIETLLRERAARDRARALAEAVVEEIQSGKSMDEAVRGHPWNPTKSLRLKRDATSIPQAVVNAAFRTAEVLRPTRVELENGDQVVLRVVAIHPGSVPSGSDRDKQLEMARQFLMRDAGQREFAALITQLRKGAEVYIKPDAE
ncbi:MAG TPA: SurA N-terminal domain-containing protein [Methylococcus sp.]|nr:SurA N-terminal domain-containing protein [Methylococcus sp.]